ncbi:MAG: hypothetical protein AUH85_17705 [Chloroflexi bacterium 13_1_40CM_4_68_4]|nr:MAG: hypothetical protein AUH85_17705 [Chloroflexi bacterium 13_1_40CM_4_68_4]
MTIQHDQFSELLEAYALRALPESERRAVERHLVGCTSCRAEASELVRVVDALPEIVGERAPSAALRERVLAAAGSDAGGAASRLPELLSRLRPAWVVAAVLAVVAAASILVAVEAEQRLRALQAERDRYAEVVQEMSRDGRSWYMSGTEAFKGSGGWLIDARTGTAAFVLFHDLRPLAGDARYAIWMISSTGKWVRAANFSPSGESLQRVDVPLSLGEYVRCSVTVEAAESGPPAGPIAMQSRDLER